MLLKVKKHILNILGKRIPEKLVIFESDDWGSIRMPDNDSFEYFASKGWVRRTDPFSRFDSLESEEDLTQLIELLKSFKDTNGRHPVITANTVVGNPDFQAIRTENFKQYKCESFVDTYRRYPQHQRSFDFFKKGIDAGVLFPQFHGREHVNVGMWLALLRAGDERFHEAFNRNCFAIDYADAGNRRSNLMAAFDDNNANGSSAVLESISEGLKQFETVFGFQSATAIAPCYVWDSKVERVLAAGAVHGLQGSKYQNIPYHTSFKHVFHYMGEVNAFGQVYTIRNCLFEPSLNPHINWVDKCMESIQIAFAWGKPAVIGTHRVNYAGFLNKENRESNLRLLKELLEKIVARWPEVRFATSAEAASGYQSNLKLN